MFVGGVVCLLAALVMRGEEGCRVCGGEDGDGTAAAVQWMGAGVDCGLCFQGCRKGCENEN